MRTIAPGKINRTLEVLGRREDGYHEIRSVMQTIDLCDEVWVEPADELRLEVTGNHEASEEDLALKAARLLAERAGRPLPALIRIEKRIPVAAGLGGGSSDAAAVLRCLDRLYQLGLSRKELAGIAADIGSDVPFFVFGGTALVEGRGERVTPLPDLPAMWMVALAPPISIPEKTKRMYESLRAEDFSDGSFTLRLVEAIRGGERVTGATTTNSFERVAYETFGDLAGYRDSLLDAGAGAAHAAGSGPALFALATAEEEARRIAGRLAVRGGTVFVARTLGASEATAVRE
jgi:4-diphosphocytidyl-2-C-methyl-D-erythritol kinase